MHRDSHTHTRTSLMTIFQNSGQPVASLIDRDGWCQKSFLMATMKITHWTPSFLTHRMPPGEKAATPFIFALEN